MIGGGVGGARVGVGRHLERDDAELERQRRRAARTS
jgi:hypothetical protein